jgi:hypothetical protein
VRLVVDDVTWADIPGAYTVAPVQPPATLAAAVPLPAFVKNAAAYATDVWTPETPVRIADRMRIRGRDFVYVIYAPLAYNAATSALRAASRVQWHLEFDVPPGGAPTPRADPVGQTAFAQVFDTTLDATSPDVFAEDGPIATAENEESEVGADYLIITADKYFTRLAPLAQLKTKMGLTVRMVNLSTITTTGDANAITDYIRNAYETWTIPPTYLLLVGDAEDLPPHNEVSHPSLTGMPATDLYYVTVDGTDIFPDMFCGRLPCATLNECSTMVDKIVNQQLSPDTDVDYRNSALTIGVFQPSIDGIEWIGQFIDKAEAFKDYLTSQGGVVHTSYTTETTTTPKSYSGSSIMHPGPSQYVGTQSYLSTAAALTQELNCLNAGVSLAVYNAHGWWGGWERLTATDVYGLSNGTRLPVVLSYTCQTGWFDMTNGTCLGEAFLRRVGGGAVAFVGATRNAHALWTDWFEYGMFEAFWPDFLETLSAKTGYKSNLTYGDNYVGRGPRLGQAKNFGLVMMYDKMAGGSQENARYHIEIQTLFGDPHMHVQPWKDNGIRATHPAVQSAMHAEFTITATDPAGEPVTGATVRLTSTAGDDLTYTTDAAGQTAVVIEPLATDRLIVEVSKTGLIPYVGSIKMETQPLTVSHPASVSALSGGFVVNVFRDITEPLSGAKVVASSADGDYQERLTDSTGRAIFSFIPLSITTMDITVSARAYTTYNGTIQMIPGTMTVLHAAQVDEARGPFTVTVRTGSQPLQAAAVELMSTQGTYGQRVTDSDGIVHFPTVPLGPETLTARTTCRGYTPVETSAQVIPGTFVWDPLPATLDRGGPEPMRVALVSSLDGSSVLTGYTGTATLEAVTISAPPPEMVIIDIRRAGAQSYVVLECVKPRGSTDAHGWQLVSSADPVDINAVCPDIKDPANRIYALNDPYAFGPSLSGIAEWQPPQLWTGSRPGWVMLLDAQTNVVDLVIWGWDEETIATMAPVIGGRAVDVHRHWSGDGLAADPSNPRITRIRNASPLDNNVAADFELDPDRVTYFPIFTTAFLASGRFLDTTPTMAGPFSNGLWTGFASVLELSSNVIFRVESGPRSGDSEEFDVVQAPHSQYGFDAFTTTQKLWNVSFPVTVRAQDRNGTTYTDFNGAARLYGYADDTAEQVLITEVGVSSASANYVELHNLSKGGANTHNWRLVVGDVPDNVNGFDATVVTLPDSVAAGALLAGVEGRAPRPGTLGFPSNVGWATGEPGWVMLLNSSYEIVDFVAWGWQESDITNMAVSVNGHTVQVGSAWVGKGVSFMFMPGRYVGSLQRKGSVDYNRSSDFRWWTSSRSAQNAGLDYPLTDARRPIPTIPASIGPFADGVWTGDLTVQEDVDGMYVEVRDALGVSGVSPRFNVRYLGPITVTVPRLTKEGVGVVTGTVSVAGIAGLTAHLHSSDTSELTVPATVTIPFGSSSAQFLMTVVDDAIVDFTQDVEIHATGPGYGAGCGLIGVQDDERCTVTFTAPASTVEGAGTLSNQGEINLSIDVGQATTFKLASSDTTEIQVPASVTLASGQNRVRFDITVVDDALADGEQTAMISVTPDDVLFKTNTVVVADNEAHHFEFRELGNVQTACVPFEVTVRALDSGGRTVAAYAGRPALSASGGQAMTPTGTAAFVAGEWVGNVSVLQPCTRINLRADDGLAQGISTMFDVTHGPLTHFSWTLSPTGTVHAGAWLPARLQACDANGFPVSSFNGPARIEVTQHDRSRPVRLLTFVRYAQMDRGYRNARAALDTYFPHVSETLTATTDSAELAQELERNDVFLLVTQADAPGGQLAALGSEWGKTLASFVEAGGVVIACSGTGDEHVLLRTAGLADLMRASAGGGLSWPSVLLTTVATNRLTKGVAASFTGEGVSGYSSAECEAIVRSTTNRVAVVMQRSVGNGQVVAIGYGFDGSNSGFARILANAVRLGLHRVPQTVAAVPEVAERFANGVWSGIVQIPGAGLDTQVDADDQAGHRSGIGLFDVVPLRLSGFRLDAVAGLVLEWPSGGVTPYAIEYAEGGPDREFLPLEWNILATPPLNTHTGTLGSAASRFYRLSVPPPPN